MKNIILLLLLSSFSFAEKAPKLGFKVIDSGNADSVEGQKITTFDGLVISNKELINVKAKTVPVEGEYYAETTVIDTRTNEKLRGTFFHIENMDPSKFKTADFKMESGKYKIKLNSVDYTYETKLSTDKSKITVTLTKHGETSKSQVFYECKTGGPKNPTCGDDGMQIFYWAGDVDGDNELDLIVMFTEKYSIMEYRLYLSSEAKEGELIRLYGKDSDTSC